MRVKLSKRHTRKEDGQYVAHGAGSVLDVSDREYAAFKDRMEPAEDVKVEPVNTVSSEAPEPSLPKRKKKVKRGNR